MFQSIASSAHPPAAPTVRVWNFSSGLVFVLGRYYWLAASAVLLLSAFNLTFRLGREIVVEWDESLYGVSAWELFQSRDWIGTTFRKALDYYNTKPPLNIWLISLSFRTFGVNLISLRLPSILSAWLTVLALQLWVRRAIGPSTALLASLVLATAFGFLYDHAGRNANTDALFALFVLLTVITLWAADDTLWRLLWLGPILAGTFLLRGMGVLMPLAIIGLVEVGRQRAWRERLPALAGAALLFVLPVGAWAFMRWRLDQWQFLGPLFFYDFVARSLRVIEGHSGTPFYHLNILQKNQFDWLSAAVVTFLLLPIGWPRILSSLAFWRGGILRLAIGSWVAVTLLMPTLIRTKLSWYLNPFYPAFALCVAAIFVHAFRDQGTGHRSRKIAVVTLLAVALCAAEARLIWYSIHRRSLANSTQGVLLSERRDLAGHRVFRSRWDNSELFVMEALIRAEPREARNLERFLAESVPGDYWIATRHIRVPELMLVRSQRRHWLYRRLASAP